MDIPALPSIAFRFGSSDSVDQDLLLPIETLPEPHVCKQLCSGGGTNRNLVVIRQGVIVDCYKGLPDETHNALLATYALHPQEHPLPLERPVLRNVPLKVTRAVRMILSYLTDTPYRQSVKAALQSQNVAQRLEILSQIDFSTVELNADAAKSLAFQFGQTLALVAGRELYTKSALKEHYPDLEPFLDRRPGNRQLLNEFRDRLCQQLRGVYIRQRGDWNLFMYENGPAIADWNQYARQSRGTVIDVRRERCVHFPMDKFFRFGEGPEIDRHEIDPATPVEIVEKVDGSMVSLLEFGERALFCCKGNFDTQQSDRAADIAATLPFDRLQLDRYWHVFEVIYPENRFPAGLSIVDYGSRNDLVLIAMRDRHTNRLLSYTELVAEARRVGLSHPQVFVGGLAQVFRAVDEAANSVGSRGVPAEGYVIRTEPDGRYFKLKYEDYKEVLRIVNRLRVDKFVADYFAADEAGRPALLGQLPGEIRRIAQEQWEQVERLREALLAYAGSVVARLPVEVAQAAKEIARQVPEAYRQLVFRVHKGQPHFQIAEKLAVDCYYNRLTPPPHPPQSRWR